MIGRTDDAGHSRSVDIDFDATTEDAGRHRAGRGPRDIALRTPSRAGRDNGYGPTLRAHSGFDAAMHRRNLNPVTIWCAETPAAGRVATADLLGDHPELTAIV